MKKLIDIDGQLWLDYRAFCLQNNLKINEELAKLISKRIKGGRQ